MELQNARYIKLSQGKQAIVDANVYEELNKHKHMKEHWNN